MSKQEPKPAPKPAPQPGPGDPGPLGTETLIRHLVPGDIRRPGDPGRLRTVRIAKKDVRQPKR